jgi:hypothetical protein
MLRSLNCLMRIWTWLSLFLAVLRIRMFFRTVIIFYGSGSGSGSFHHQAKKLIQRWFLLFNDFLSLKTDVNVPTESIKQKNKKKTYFLLASWKFLMKSGSISGCLNQVYGSKDPEPYQTVTDPEHWFVCYHCDRLLKKSDNTSQLLRAWSDWIWIRI